LVGKIIGSELCHQLDDVDAVNDLYDIILSSKSFRVGTASWVSGVFLA
jgi:hypothetical protein